MIEPDNELSSRPERSGVERPALPAISALQQISTDQSKPLHLLRRFTPARIALNISGDSLPTKELLDFSLAHAIARDAVHAQLDVPNIIQQLSDEGLESIQVHSAAPDRSAYLRRPDLGRKLDEFSRNALAARSMGVASDLVFIIADGLSAIAPARYAVPVIHAARKFLPGWQIAPVVLARQARVALGDEIGQILGGKITVMLIGERPGLSSPDSLGIYLTHAPRVGRTDAERNCISNVRTTGMSAEQAAQTLLYLLTESLRLQLSGVALKDARAEGLQASSSSLKRSRGHSSLPLNEVEPGRPDQRRLTKS